MHSDATKGGAPPGREWESETLLRLFVERVRDYAIYLLDPEGRIATWNPGAARLKGYTAEEVLGRPVDLFYLPEDIAAGKPRRDLETAAREGELREEAERIRGDGTRFRADLLLVALRDDEGRLRGYAKLTRDLTEQRRQTDAIQRERTFLRAVIDTTPAMIFAKDWEGRFTLANKAVAAIYGTTPEELLGKSDADFNPNREEVDAFIRADREVISTGRPLQIPEEPVTNPATGETRWFQTLKIRFQPREGDPAQVMGVSTDITDRKRVEAALAESESGLRLLLDQLPAIVWSVDRELRFTSSRGLGLDGVGLQPGELVGRRLQDTFPPDAPELPAHQKALAGESAAYVGTFAGRTFRGHVQPLVGPDGTVTGAIGAALDVTELAEATRALERLNEELETRVARRTAELQAANRELEAFSYSVSHDLRAPLRAVDGFSQALLEDYAGQLDEAGRGYLERVRAGAQKMGRLIDDLLRLSRATRVPMRRRDIDLSALARTLAREEEQADPSRKVSFVIQDGIVAHGDPDLVRILLHNLLRNAWKFTRPVPEPRIELFTGERDGLTAFCARDNGVGFDMKYADKLFAAFQRLHSSEEFEGTGIGLALVARIAHRHGGEVWASSEPGKGATFCFTLGGTE